jgi:3-dehydroquinate dehydratase-2
MNLLIANGPNLSLVGRREPEVYGAESLTDSLEQLRSAYPKVEMDILFSNHEGELIDAIHEHGFSADGIILNPGGFTHTSVALRDAVAAVSTPVLEVHISNPLAREPFRHVSLISPVALGTISGLGIAGYRLAVDWYVHQANG